MHGVVGCHIQNNGKVVRQSRGLDCRAAAAVVVALIVVFAIPKKYHSPKNLESNPCSKDCYC